MVKCEVVIWRLALIAVVARNNDGQRRHREDNTGTDEITWARMIEFGITAGSSQCPIRACGV